MTVLALYRSNDLAEHCEALREWIRATASTPLT